MRANSIKHLRNAPYHSSSNGLAERFVGTFKRALRVAEHSGIIFHQQLMNFLLSYRITPQSTTGVSPASLFLNRHLQTRLDLLHPSITDKVELEQARQKGYHDVHTRTHKFSIGQRVLAHNFLSDPKLISGTIIGQQGPLSYFVQIRGGRQWKRHTDQLLATGDSPQEGSNSVAEYTSVPPSPISPPVSNSIPQPTGESCPSRSLPDPVSDPSQDVLPSSPAPKTVQGRRQLPKSGGTN